LIQRNAGRYPREDAVSQFNNGADMTAQRDIPTASRGVVDRLIDWLQKRREIGELDQLDIQEFSRLATELNMAPGDLDALVRRGPRAADEMTDLLRALGFDQASIAAIQPARRQSMERACAGCLHKSICGHDLQAGLAAEKFASYCNNADEIGALLQNHAGQGGKSADGIPPAAR
jgi:hypothetical protein